MSTPSLPRAKPPLAAVLAAFAAIYVIWGSTYLGIKVAIETLPPFTMAGARFLVAGALLYGWSRLRGAPRPTAAEVRAAAVVGTLLLLGGNGGVVWAEGRIPSGVAALLVATVALWMVGLDALRTRTWPRPAVMAGVALGLAGVGVLVGPAALGGGEPVDALGALAVVAGSLSWAAGSVYQRAAPKPDAVLLGVGVQMLVGGAVLLAFGLAVGERVDVAAVSGRSWGALVYLVVVGALVGYSAYVWLLGVTTPERVSTYAFVNPVVAVLLGWALADEALSPRVACAAVAVVAAVGLLTVAKKGDAEADPD